MFPANFQCLHKCVDFLLLLLGMAYRIQPAFFGRDGVVDAQAANRGGGKGEVYYRAVVAYGWIGIVGQTHSASSVENVLDSRPESIRKQVDESLRNQLQTEQVAVGALSEFAGFDAGFVFGKRGIQCFAGGFFLQ